MIIARMWARVFVRHPTKPICVCISICVQTWRTYEQTKRERARQEKNKQQIGNTNLANKNLPHRTLFLCAFNRTDSEFFYQGSATKSKVSAHTSPAGFRPSSDFIDTDRFLLFTSCQLSSLSFNGTLGRVKLSPRRPGDDTCNTDHNKHSSATTAQHTQTVIPQLTSKWPIIS